MRPAPQLAGVLFRRTALATAAVALIAAVGFGALTVVNVHQEVRAARELTELAVQAARTGALQRQQAWPSDPDPRSLRGLRLHVVDTPGEAATQPPARSLLESLTTRWFGVSDRFVIPLGDDASGPALVVEGHAVGELQEQVFDMSIVLVALALALGALGVGHGWVVRGVRDPLSDMTRAATRMAEGELSRRVPDPPVAEFSALAKALNHLAESLEQTRRMQNELTLELVSLRENERKSLARELHDDLGQRLAVIAAEIHLLRASGSDNASIASVAAGIHSLQHSVRSILERLRHGQPMVLPDLDLPGVLEEWRRREPTVRFQVEGIDATSLSLLGEAARETGARVLQEALANAFRHARPARVSVRLALDSTAGRLIIGNDGVSARPGAAGNGYGIIGMRERACAGGGDLQAGPAAVAGGWEVTLRLPLAHRSPAALPGTSARAWPGRTAEHRSLPPARQAQPLEEPLQDA